MMKNTLPSAKFKRRGQGFAGGARTASNLHGFEDRLGRRRNVVEKVAQVSDDKMMKVNVEHGIGPGLTLAATR